MSTAELGGPACRWRGAAMPTPLAAQRGQHSCCSGFHTHQRRLCCNSKRRCHCSHTQLQLFNSTQASTSALMPADNRHMVPAKSI
jgi:hypothetical protein